MQKFLILAASLSSTTAAALGNSDIKFEEFVAKFKKPYQFHELALRKELFEKTKISVVEQNKRHQAGESEWWAEINAMADWTPSELRAIRGTKPNPHSAAAAKAVFHQRSVNNYNNNNNNNNPDSVSWMDIQSPVKNQGACGSCWAFATTEVLESHLAIAENTTTPLVLAPQTLVNCVKNPKKCGGTGGCQGAIAEIGFNFTRDFSMALESDLPYQAQNEPCTNYTKTVTCDGYVKNIENSADDLERALTVGPVAVTVSANWATYGGGIFSDGCTDYKTFGVSCTLDHAVVAVGYTKNYWVVRNSWGAGWGEKGYIRLTRVNDDVIYKDTQTADGDACAPYPETQSPAGESGILFDTAYPTGVHRDGPPPPAPPVCKDTEFCCPDAKHCLTPTHVSCLDNSNACSSDQVCCPLTKICVKVGKPCVSPCQDQGTYCCPDAKHCLTPVPGVFCNGDAKNCQSGQVCCPVTDLCVDVGAACVPSFQDVMLMPKRK